MLGLVSPILIHNSLTSNPFPMLEDGYSKVIYAGDLGSFSHQATELAKKRPFLAGKSGLVFEPSTSPARVIERLHAGEAEFGVIPFRNPLVAEGTIVPTEETFARYGIELPPAQLKGDEWWSRLRKMHPDWDMSDPIPLTMLFHVLADPNVRPDEVRRVVGFHVATAQCLQGLDRVIGRPFELVDTYSDSAKAAADLRQLLDDPNYVSPDEAHETEQLKPVGQTGVLANQACADLYNLKIIFDSVQDNPDGNTTTFAVLRNPWHL